MRKLLLFVFAINIILLSYVTFQNNIYRNYLIPRLLWAVDTLYLDFSAERELYLSCKKQMVPM